MSNINSKTTITKNKSGYWLYDENRGMNLSIRAASKEAALIESLEYYQERLIYVETENRELHKNIDSFLEGLKSLEELE